MVNTIESTEIKCLHCSCIFPALKDGYCRQHLQEMGYDISLHDVVNFEYVYKFRSIFNSRSEPGKITGFGILHNDWYRRLKTPGQKRGRKKMATQETPQPVTPEILSVKTMRTKLPEERQSINHKFVINQTRCYLIVGMYPDGRPGEIFLKIDKVGSIEHGMADAFSKLFSIALQHGIPLAYLVQQFSYMRFTPSGITSSTNKDLKFATSIIDYVVRWMEMKFLNGNGHAKRVVAHCHLCNLDFYSISDSVKHDKENLEVHRTINEGKIN